MSRYIDADNYKKDLIQLGFLPALVVSVLDKQPTADVVKVVRCKDCVSSRPLNRNDRFEARYSDGCVYCMRTDEGVAYADYCSYGERRKECL